MSVKDRPVRPQAERFWEKVTRDPDTDCWEWVAKRNQYGYGTFAPACGKGSRMAHRSAYEMLVGPVPDGLQLDHLCRNRGCVNPTHLEPVTSQENKLRSPWFHKSHCPKGHPYEGYNLYISPRGDWQCRTCRNTARRKIHAKQRARRGGA